MCVSLAFTVPIVVLPICLDAPSELLALSSVSGGDVSDAACGEPELG